MSEWTDKEKEKLKESIEKLNSLLFKNTKATPKSSENFNDWFGDVFGDTFKKK